LFDLHFSVYQELQTQIIATVINAHGSELWWPKQLLTTGYDASLWKYGLVTEHVDLLSPAFVGYTGRILYADLKPVGSGQSLVTNLS
jgi:hypothetical protein